MNAASQVVHMHSSDSSGNSFGTVEKLVDILHSYMKENEKLKSELEQVKLHVSSQIEQGEQERRQRVQQLLHENGSLKAYVKQLEIQIADAKQCNIEKSSDDFEQGRKRKRKGNLCVQAAVRTAYASLRETPSFTGFVFTAGAGMKGITNRQACAAVVNKVLLDNQKLNWDSAEVEAACQTYWRTQRDAYSRHIKGTHEKHNRSISRRERMRRKMNWRKKALQYVQWSVATKDKMRSVLNFEYTSSDEDEIHNIHKKEKNAPKRIRRLLWESDELREYKSELDRTMSEKFLKHRITRCKVKRPPTCVSARNPPDDAPIWTVNRSFTAGNGSMEKSSTPGDCNHAEFGNEIAVLETVTMPDCKASISHNMLNHHTATLQHNMKCED
ncbi:uncharacterized protein LOC144453630 [Glandiceps talaboti]